MNRLKGMVLNIQTFASPMPNGGTHERVDKYSAAILELLRKSLVTADGVVFSTDYEGEAKSGGAVKIPVRDGEAVMGDYNIATGKALTQSSTSYLTVTLDTDKAINEIIDGYEANVVPDNIVAQRITSASYTMQLQLDTSGIITLESGGTTSTNTTQTTKTTAYENLLNEGVQLDLADVPRDRRYAIVSPSYYALLKQDNNFVSPANAIGFQDIKVKGFVGVVDGVIILVSNNMDVNTEFILGSNIFSQRINAFTIPPMINNLTNEFIGASALQGRTINKHVVTRKVAVRIKTHA